MSNALTVSLPREGQGMFGRNVHIFDSSMATSDIQARIDWVYEQTHFAQFGAVRHSLLFKPGSYAVNIPVGFYTHVAGLGEHPHDVQITGSLYSEALFPNHNATCNFWRSVENLTVATGKTMKWAVSQATPMRRLHIRDALVLCEEQGWSSGGFIADTLIDGDVHSGTQQQFLCRNTEWQSWTGSSWNMVFVGALNAPRGEWPQHAFTVVDQTPLCREKPFLCLDTSDNWQVFVPALRRNSVGVSWKNGQDQGHFLPLESFYIANAEADDATSLNAALTQGRHLLLCPGIYHLHDTLRVSKADTCVLGLGFATLVPENGQVAMTVADVGGVILGSLLFDAGEQKSPILLEVGPHGSLTDHSGNPTTLHDLHFRVGGAAVGRATTSLCINSRHVIGDQFWIWRADHGDGVAWDLNTADTGLLVNGSDVTIYGLFVEHYQQFQTLWNGDRGRCYFYQSELPYDAPSQNAWTSAPGVKGWASYKVTDQVDQHEAWGLGVYSVFKCPGVILSRAVEAPTKAGMRFHHITTVGIDRLGEISHVINDRGDCTRGGASYKPRVEEYP